MDLKIQRSHMKVKSLLVMNIFMLYVEISEIPKRVGENKFLSEIFLKNFFTKSRTDLFIFDLLSPSDLKKKNSEIFLSFSTKKNRKIFLTKILQKKFD